ncbi:MAG: DUF853 family protein [Myxococcales bacterium]|nr:DUF853 family protein [Myxococcales bacterium]
MDPLQLSVSELRCAVIDPQWRERFIANREAVTTVGGGGGAVIIHATTFHGLARKLVKKLRQGALPIDASPDELFRLMLGEGADKLIQKLLKEDDVSSAAALIDALHTFASRVDSIRAGRPEATAWTSLFITEEHPLELRLEVGKRLVFINGIVDGLRWHPTGIPEVVDYKLTQGQALDKELVQLAIYHRLVVADRASDELLGSLEYFHPKLHLVPVSSKQLRGIYEDVVYPVIVELAERMGAEGPERPTRALRIGHTRRAAGTGEPVEIETAEFTRHVGVLGGSGSGKTTLALQMVEQLLERNVSVLLVDRKGDLCQYADPSVTDRSEGRLRKLLGGVDVSLYTPGLATGRALGIRLVPPGTNHLDPELREPVFRSAAQGLGQMMKLKDGAPGIAGMMKAIQVASEAQPSGAPTLQDLIEIIQNEDARLLDAIGALDPKHLKKLVDPLQTLEIMKGSLFSTQGETLSAEALFARPGDGKPRLTIISTKFLGDESSALFWVAQLLFELQRYASLSPSPELKAVAMFDEADLYLPANKKPITKEPMESLLKRARSAGLGIMLLSQSPGDFDYKSRENIRTWFLGLIKQPNALEKLKTVMQESGVDPKDVLPQQKVGEFFMISEKRTTALKAVLSLVGTKQLSEDEIVAIARQNRR